MKTCLTSQWYQWRTKLRPATTVWRGLTGWITETLDRTTLIIIKTLSALMVSVKTFQKVFIALLPENMGHLKVSKKWSHMKWNIHSTDTLKAVLRSSWTAGCMVTMAILQARNQFSHSSQVYSWQLSLDKVVETLLWDFMVFFCCLVKLFGDKFRDSWVTKEKTMKGVRTVGKGTTGVGMRRGGGAGTTTTRKGLECFLAQKMELSFCQGRISFHADWLLNNTRAELSLLASVPQLVSLCHSLVSPLYQHRKTVGWELGGFSPEHERKGGHEGWIEGLCESSVVFVLGERRNKLRGFSFLNKRSSWVWSQNEAPTLYQQGPRGLGWAWKPHTSLSIYHMCCLGAPHNNTAGERFRVHGRVFNKLALCLWAA